MLSKRFIFTSAYKVEGGYVFTPSVCGLCVFLSGGYLKKLWTDPDDIWWACWVSERTKYLNFGEDTNPDPDLRSFFR